MISGEIYHAYHSNKNIICHLNLDIQLLSGFKLIQIYSDFSQKNKWYLSLSYGSVGGKNLTRHT